MVAAINGEGRPHSLRDVLVENLKFTFLDIMFCFSCLKIWWRREGVSLRIAMQRMPGDRGYVACNDQKVPHGVRHELPCPKLKL